MGCRRSCPIIFAQYFLATGYLVAVGTISASAQEAAIVQNTYVYKRIDNLELKADVSSTEGDAVRPVVLWLHGGALILGDRGSTDRVLRQKLPRAGYVFVSVDYRLAPETKLAAILEDIDSAYAWIRAEG